MTTSAKTGVSARTSSLLTYQTILYDRALHPELFSLRGRKVVRHGEYEFEAWVMRGAHVLRFEHGPVCACELVTDQEDGLPTSGVLATLLCAGDHELEHPFSDRRGAGRAVYMTSVQTESLSESLYLATMEELQEHARECEDVLLHTWEEDGERCLSLIDIQRFNREVHVQSYHLQARGGLVLRTQSLFEHV